MCLTRLAHFLVPASNEGNTGKLLKPAHGPYKLVPDTACPAVMPTESFVPGLSSIHAGALVHFGRHSGREDVGIGTHVPHGKCLYMVSSKRSRVLCSTEFPSDYKVPQGSLSPCSSLVFGGVSFCSVGNRQGVQARASIHERGQGWSVS